MFCGKCGKQIDEKAKFCPYCGVTIGTDKKSKKKSKKNIVSKINIVIITVILLIIVGIYGWAIWVPIQNWIFPYSGTKYWIIRVLTTEKPNEISTEETNEELPKESSEPTTETEVVQTVQAETEQPTEPESIEYESIEAEEEIDAGEYILPECDTRVYSREELQNLSKEQLRLARNEIYARHGRKFSADDLNAYFSSKAWYTPLYEGAEIDAKGDSILNQNEIANRNLIVELEAEK
ncbi:YARHG domain-containing protein [Brotaphodocola sp.]|uniref:YARHG domain-containing protein n=1 Tax=Brotaphodocola sp. TaxID=3073577 RepID=UPI003D7D3DBA